VRFVEADVLGSDWRSLVGSGGAHGDETGSEGAHDGEVGRFDLAVCFGMFHHVPGAARRARLLGDLLACLAPRGVACCSLWRFMSDERLARKARAGHERRRALVEESFAGFDAHGLEEGDWLLGWQDDEDAVRYCHSFSDEEATSLAETGVACGARLVGSFLADGRSGTLNRYLVFSRDR